MQRLILFSIWITTIIVIFTVTEVKANDTLTSLIYIRSLDEELTGDAIKENLKLQVNYLSDDSDLFQHITLDINNSFQKEWNLSLKGGYDPKLSFYDLNHDKTLDIFYEVAINTDK